MRYTLTATDAEGSTVLRIEAEDDVEAMFSAIAKTLDRAIKSERWAKGRITLTDSNGVIVKEMAPK